MNPSKKRPVEDALASSFAAAAAGAVATEEDAPLAPPATKKPKLSKKELLLQAKLRLKEAQEKKKALQDRLEEQKAKEQQEEAASEQAEQTQYEEYGAYEDDYYYEYHIPPVTGATDSLLITNITNIGPPEKVRFIVNKWDCIESVMKVIQERKTSQAAAAVAGGPILPNPPNNNIQAGPGGAGGPTVRAPNTSTIRQSQPRPPPAPLPPPSGQDRAAKLDSRVATKPIQTQDEKPPRANLDRNSRSRPGNGSTQAAPTLPEKGPIVPVAKDNAQGPKKATPKPSPIISVAKEDSSAQAPKAKATAKLPEAREPRPQPTKVEPIKPAKRSSTKEKPARVPPAPTKTAWKRGLAQITGKTLDCKLDLASKTSYMIRTQDQGIVAQVQFFSAPNNPKLLEHHPSKRQLQDHLAPLQRLPCNATHAWKGQDILDFLKRQDERRTTYQPPAQRNLPMSHWALVELEEPLLRGPESLGYFTAMLASAVKGGNSAANSKGNDKPPASSEITFAGKLVWNMTDPVTASSPNAPSPRNSKLSKWGEVVAAVPTTGIRNSALVATVQGFYELPPPKPAWASKKNDAPEPIVMPQKLQARKVILPKSRTIGIIIGPAPTPEIDPANPPAADNNNNNKNARNQNNGNNNGAGNNPQQFGCCQVLFPNGMASGSTSIQSLKGSRAILYD